MNLKTFRRLWRSEAPKLQKKNVDSIDFSEFEVTSTEDSRDLFKRFANI